GNEAALQKQLGNVFDREFLRFRHAFLSSSTDASWLHSLSVPRCAWQLPRPPLRAYIPSPPEAGQQWHACAGCSRAIQLRRAAGRPPDRQSSWSRTCASDETRERATALVGLY